MKLTDVKCRTVKPTDRTQKLFDGGGLYMEITPAGAKHWRLKYRYLGKERKLCIGPYPLYSLLEAREKRDEVKKQLRAGIDPAALKIADRRRKEMEHNNTFEKIALEWSAHNKNVWSANHVRTVETRLSQDIFPVIGKKPISQITAIDLLGVVRKIEKREAYEVARRCLQYCSQIFRYAILNGHIDRNPAPDLKGALKSVSKGHYAAFDAAELPNFIEKFRRNDARLFPQTRLAVELMMLTFVRTGELIKASWDEFDFEQAIWRIPASKMKMKREHLVPLSSQAITLLLQLREMNGKRQWVFPSLSNPRKHMSNNTILTALARMGYRGIMTGHGFRSLAMSTIMEQLGYRFEVPDRQLAHKAKGPLGESYNRAQFLDERKRMMQDWANYIDNCCQGSKMPKGKAAIRVFVSAHEQHLEYDLSDLLNLKKRNHPVPNETRLRKLEAEVNRARSFYTGTLEKAPVTNTERDNKLRCLKYAARSLQAAIFGKDVFLYPALKSFQKSYLALDFTARASLYSIFENPLEASVFLIHFDLITIKRKPERTAEVLNKIATMSLHSMVKTGYNFRDPHLARLLGIVAPIFREVTGRSTRIGYNPYMENRPSYFGDWIRNLLEKPEISNRAIETIAKINDL